MIYNLHDHQITHTQIQ